MVQYRVRIKKVTTVYRDFLVDTKSKKELRQKLNDILYDGIEMVPEIHQCIDNHLSSEKCGVYNTAFEIEQIGKIDVYYLMQDLFYLKKINLFILLFIQNQRNGTPNPK